MYFSRFLLVLVIITYIYAASSRVPDSDFESYLDYFDGKYDISECYFEYGFCYLVQALNIIEISSVLAMGLPYGLLLLTVLFLYISFSQTALQSFITIIIVVIFLALVNDYYMAFHLYRQNFSVLLFSVLAFINPLIAFLLAGFFHASFIAILPIYLLIRNSNFSVTSTQVKFLVYSLLSYLSAKFLLQYFELLADFNFNFITSRAQLYEDYMPSDAINVTPLLAYSLLVFLISKKMSQAHSKIFDTLFCGFIASILMALLTSFNELLMYRFLVVAKGLSLPILMISIPHTFFKLSTSKSFF